MNATPTDPQASTTFPVNPAAGPTHVLSELVATATSSPQEVFDRLHAGRYPRFFLLRGWAVAIFLLYCWSMGFPERGGEMGAFQWYLWIALHFWGHILVFCIARFADRQARLYLAETEVNFAIAETTTDELSKVIAKRPKLTTLLNCIPETSANRDTAIIRMLRRMVDDASNWRFDSLQSLLPPYQREAVLHRSHLAALQQLSIRLGILGAFLGMITVLAQLAPMIPAIIKADTDNRQMEFVLRALFLKFGPSIGGIIGSVYIQGLTMILAARQEQYFRSMQRTAQAMMSAVLRAFNENDFAHHFSQIREQIKGVDAAIREQNQHVEEMLDQCRDVARVPDENAKVIDRMRVSQEKFIEDFRKLHDLAALGKLMESFQHGLQRITTANQTALSQQIQDYNKTSAQTLTELRRDVRFLVGPMKQYLVLTVLGVLTLGIILGVLVSHRF